MTMHLERGLTTLNTKRRKPKKMTTKRLTEITNAWRSHNKYMKKIKAPNCIMTFEQYVKYSQGKWKPRQQPKIVNDPFGRDISYSRPGPNIPMSNTIPTNGGAKKEQMQYSGKRKLIGIGLMHKSNLVPIWDKEGAEEISKMRRN